MGLSKSGVFDTMRRSTTYSHSGRVAMAEVNQRDLALASLATTLRRLEKADTSADDESVYIAEILTRMAFAVLDGAPLKGHDADIVVTMYFRQLKNDTEYEFLDDTGGFWTNCDSCLGELLCFGWGDSAPSTCKDCEARQKGPL
jgi:hypothetical protein